MTIPQSQKAVKTMEPALERIARAIYEAAPQTDTITLRGAFVHVPVSWENIDAAHRELARRQARAVLELTRE